MVGVRTQFDYQEPDAETVETIPKYRPPDIHGLSESTRFSPATLKKLYRGFKTECPSGLLTEDVFKQVCLKFFPFNSSSSLYFNYVFSCIDTKAVGNITFEEFVKTLDLLKNGSLNDKICWIFRLYDVNRDGTVCIS